MTDQELLEKQNDFSARILEGLLEPAVGKPAELLLFAEIAEIKQRLAALKAAEHRRNPT